MDYVLAHGLKMVITFKQTNVATRSRVERVLFGLEVLPNSATARLQAASLKKD